MILYQKKQLGGLMKLGRKYGRDAINAGKKFFKQADTPRRSQEDIWMDQFDPEREIYTQKMARALDLQYQMMQGGLDMPTHQTLNKEYDFLRQGYPDMPEVRIRNRGQQNMPRPKN